VMTTQLLLTVFGALSAASLVLWTWRLAAASEQQQG